MPVARTDRRPIRFVDVLIVGSGPVGAAVAATISLLRPNASILIVDAGATLTDPPGGSLRDLPSGERERLDQSCIDPLTEALEAQATATRGLQSVGLRMCVGGMSSIWSAAVPRPSRWEVPDLVPWPEMARRLDQAEHLLNMANPTSEPEPRAVVDLRARLADFGRAAGWSVGPRRLPAAEVFNGGRRVPAGTSTVLRRVTRRTALRDASLCRRLHIDRKGNVRSAEIVDLRVGSSFTTLVGAVAVAGNAFRTPQLLWASHIRSAALGRYLHEHPMVNARGVAHGPRGQWRTEPNSDVDVLGRTWIPSGEGGERPHGQVLHLRPSIGVAGSVVVLGWYVAQDVTPDNRLDFDGGLGDDPLGMPVPRVSYQRSLGDNQRVAAAATDMRSLHISGLIEFAGAEAPLMAVRGLSRHFLGSTRMGQSPEDSVCDSSGRVWGHGNLFVAGTGVIGWPTSSNPTLTAIAHAYRAGEEIATLL